MSQERVTGDLRDLFDRVKAEEELRRRRMRALLEANLLPHIEQFNDASQREIREWAEKYGAKQGDTAS